MDTAADMEEADYEHVGYADDYEQSGGAEHQSFQEHVSYHHEQGYHVYQLPGAGVNAAGPASPLQRQPSQPYATLQYPPAEASHEQVLVDSALFFETLKRLHDVLGTKFRIPVVAGQDLDLHLMYRQVTAFGGLEAVISSKKWSEVAQPFNFPPSFTSRSFTMRKIYSQFLHHYEQVYYHRNTGPICPAPGSVNAEALAQVSMKRRAEMVQSGQGYAPPVHTPALIAISQNFPPPPHNPNLVGTQLVGTVDAKFDCGYFVTVQAGGHQYRGILYSPPPYLVPSAPPPLPTADSSQDIGGSAKVQYAEKKFKPLKDPNKPKQNKTPFNYFSIDARARAKELYPDADQKEISKIVGEMWSNAAGEEKQPYIDQAKRDRERYERELAEYHRAMQALHNGDDRCDKDSDALDPGQHQSLSSVPSPQDPYHHHHHHHHHHAAEHPNITEQMYAEVPHAQHPRNLQDMSELSGVQLDMYHTGLQHGLLPGQHHHAPSQEHISSGPPMTAGQVYQWTGNPAVQPQAMELPYTLPLHIGEQQQQQHFPLNYAAAYPAVQGAVGAEGEEQYEVKREVMDADEELEEDEEQ